LLVLVVGIGFAGGDATKALARRMLVPRWGIEVIGHAAGYRVELHAPRDDEVAMGRRVVVVAPDGTTALSMQQFYPTFGIDGGAGDDTPGFGKDIDGDRVPDLVIHCDSGGSGGYFTTYVFGLDHEGITPSAILENLKIEASDDGTFRAVGFDSTLRYRVAANAASPHPLIVMRPAGGRWHLDREAMKANAPDQATIDAAIQELEMVAPDRTDYGAWQAPVLRIMAQFLYAGHTAEARDFLRRYWRAAPLDLDKVERDLHDAFKESPYAGELRELAAERGDIRWP
jgi:hypothetical protein